MGRIYIFPNLFFFHLFMRFFSIFPARNVYVSICGQYFVCLLDIQMNFRPIHFHERERERCLSDIWLRNICYPLRIWLNHPTWYPIESEIHIRFGKKWIEQCARYIFSFFFGLTCSLSNPPMLAHFGFWTSKIQPRIIVYIYSLQNKMNREHSLRTEKRRWSERK